MKTDTILYSVVISFIVCVSACTDKSERYGRPQFFEKLSVRKYQDQCYRFNDLLPNKTPNKIDSCSNSLIKYIDSLKVQLLKVSKQKDPFEISINWKGEQMDVDSLYCIFPTTNLLIGPDETNPVDEKWSAKELRKKIDEFKREIMISTECSIPYVMIDCSDISDEQGIKLTWEIGTFYHMPLIEILSTLKNIQIEARKISIAFNRKKSSE